MEVTAKRSIAEKVNNRVKTGKCLICDGDATRRGLCQKHYQLFRRHMLNKSDEERPEFEAAAIREGKVLPVNQVREIMRDDPFTEL